MSTAFIESHIQPRQMLWIGIQYQRETTVVWDKQTGLPITNAMFVQSRQTSDMSVQLKADGYAVLVHDATGCLMYSTFSALKIRWILDQVSGAQERAVNGVCLLCTKSTVLSWKLSGGAIHVTDTTNASRTMLFNIHK